MLSLSLVNLTSVILFVIVLCVFLSTVQSFYNTLFDFTGMKCVINELCCKVIDIAPITQYMHMHNKNSKLKVAHLMWYK